MSLKKETALMACLILALIIFSTAAVMAAVPVGPTITRGPNSTKAIAPPTVVNDTGNGITAGGYIFTVNLNSEQQNLRWKAYVGNVTGTLVLDDANGQSIYDWALATSPSGEVYATRASSVISWSTIACASASNISLEERALNHTANPSDNISRTFNYTNNQALDVGAVSIGASACPTTNLYENATTPTNDNFEEILLHDQTNMVYTSILEQNANGYDTSSSGKLYDFEMIVPEVALASWQSSTAYYFYVELT